MEQRIIRKLGSIEQAFTISNEAFPLSVVCVLHLTGGPEIPVLIRALRQLQTRHPLLRAGIEKVGGRFFFRELDPLPPLELRTVRREEPDTWRSTTEHLLNTTFDKKGPLVKCCYVLDEEKEDSELIIAFHHAIIDGVAARLILHELLSLCGGFSLPDGSFSSDRWNHSPPYGRRTLLKRLAALTGRQVADEWRYKRNGIASPIPGHSRNAILSFRLSPALSRKLSVKIGRAGLSLNSMLLAVMTQAVFRRRHAEKGRRLARVISFAEMRSSQVSPVSPGELGCYISMLRLTAPVAPEQSPWELAAHIRRALFQAGRRGEVLTMSVMSKYLIKMALTLKNRRLGVSALSFLGKLDLEPRYNRIRLRNVTAFITNNQYGPELSAFGKVLFGSIGLDFTYLTAEMDAEEARQIVEDIKESLENMANLS